MEIKKGRKITFADVNVVFGNVVKLASLNYGLYRIVAHANPQGAMSVCHLQSLAEGVSCGCVAAARCGKIVLGCSTELGVESATMAATVSP